jgi:hypothetical protein
VFQTLIFERRIFCVPAYFIGPPSSLRRVAASKDIAVEDKRRVERIETEQLAHVSFGGTSLSCVIRNISAEGAAIDVDNAAYIPQRFQLVLPPDRGVRDCRLVWIKRNRIGVAFDS